MKYKYKYIYFKKTCERPVNYTIYNNRSNEEIGTVSYYSRWRQYVFSGESFCVFNISCLRDVIHFIEQLPRKSGGPKQEEPK